jgi:release factor glutamine methyltransferase
VSVAGAPPQTPGAPPQTPGAPPQTPGAPPQTPGAPLQTPGAPLQTGTRVREAIAGAVTAIAAGGCETPRLDAELLLAHVLGVERERLLSDERLEVRGGAVRAFQLAVRRRAIEREPVAYIVGRRAFRRLELGVDRRALIPRPESELLVEAAIELPAGARVLDVGTGCGAIALALKHERPDLVLSGSDCSSAALELAAENAARLGLDVRWLHADQLSGVPDEFDAVLANLPYVADAERRSLAPEILRHEPPSALFAGPDGLAAIAALLAQLARRATVAMLALEVGAGQAPAVVRMTQAAGFARVRRERDLAGIERIVVGEGRRR